MLYFINLFEYTLNFHGLTIIVYYAITKYLFQMIDIIHKASSPFRYILNTYKFLADEI